MPPSKRLSIAPAPVGEILPSVRDTIAQLGSEPKDAALRRLAEHYARSIDEARMIAIDARRLLDASAKGDIEIPKRMLNALVKHSESDQVLADLGPRLQAALESLGASPKARAAMTGKGDKPDAPTPKSSRAERRERAAARTRQFGSAPVDSPSA